MRLRAFLWLALSSFPSSSLWGETRPRYGGTLNVDLSSTFNSLDATEVPQVIWRLIGQTLVRINSHGEPEPLLASGWQREADGLRWRFSLRNDVHFQDGEALNAGTVAPILLPVLKMLHGDVAITAGGSTLVIQAASGLPNLPSELADPRAAIVRTSEANIPVGTGPFRVANWEPGRRLALAAFEDYWGSRPFLDSILVSLGSTRASADLFDVPFSSPRRILPESAHLWQSAPRELLALVAQNVRPELVHAFALAIDRAPIVNVLAQRRGVPAFGLLPQWLSGYEFLFQNPLDITRAREIVSGLRNGPITMSYPANDSFARAVAERIALNARDAGIAVQVSTNVGAGLRLMRCPIESPDSAAGLVNVGRCLGFPEQAILLDSSKPDRLYQAERALLESNRVVPLAHLDSVYGLSSRVHTEDSGSQNPLTPHLDDFWVDP